MNCKNCGTSVSPNHKFCLNCGTPINSVEPQANIENQNLNNTVEQSTVNPVSVMPVEQPAVTQDLVMPVGQPQMNNMVQPQYQQPNMNVLPQQPQVAPMGTMPVAQPKKDNKLVFIIIGIVAVTAVIIAIMFFVLGGDSDEKEPVAKEDNNVVEKEPQKEEEKEPTTSSLTVENFTYNYPETYESEKHDGYVSFISDAYYIELAVNEGVSFSVLDAESAQTAVEGIGATVVSSQIKTINGNSYIVVRANYNGVECVFLYSKSTLNYGITGYGFKLDYTYDEQIEVEIASFAENVIYNSSSSNEV